MANRNARINLNVEETLRYKIKKLSLEKGTSMTQLIEELLIDYVEKAENQKKR